LTNSYDTESPAEQLRRLGSPHVTADGLELFPVRHAQWLLGWAILPPIIAGYLIRPFLRVVHLGGWVIVFNTDRQGTRTGVPDSFTLSPDVSLSILLGLGVYLVVFTFYATWRLLLALRYPMRSRIGYLVALLVPGVNLLALFSLSRHATRVLRRQ
jgi:hypothetical protein